MMNIFIMKVVGVEQGYKYKNLKIADFQNRQEYRREDKETTTSTYIAVYVIVFLYHSLIISQTIFI